jgi:hypothetical protein
MSALLQEIVKFVKGLAPAADRWDTGPATDIVRATYHNQVGFLVHQAGGTTGKATLTILACDDAAGTNPVAIPFKYQVGASGAGAGGDAWGAITDAAAAGFDTTPGTDRLYMLAVYSASLPANKPFVYLKSVEAVNDPVTGSVEIVLSEPRYQGSDAPTVIA